MDDAPPFTLSLPATGPSSEMDPVMGPVVITSPHSGRLYPLSFLRASRLNEIEIRRSEDSFVEELFAAGPGIGMPLLAANFPRAYCDANREAWELDPAMFEDELPLYVNAVSKRVSAGLGTIARTVGTGEPIYHGKLRFAEAEARIQACWQPYHESLRSLIAGALHSFTGCLVLDCHSMPAAVPALHVNATDIVLGDNYGTACAPALMTCVEATLRDLGFAVRRNQPYAGGYITRHYGVPAQAVHVIQIELSRGLYMNERSLSKHHGFAPLQSRLTRFLHDIDSAARQHLPPRQGEFAAAAE